MSFCRITGRCRALPKPNYFPLLAPISPADAKRCCRITGKSYGLPTHHYIPVLLTANSSKTKCKITNVSGELGPHHYSPEIHYGNRKHEVLPGYRYIFPVLDGSTEAQKALMDVLLTKQVSEDKRYVYTVQERRCSLVFSAQMEAAVRDGDVRDVMLAKDSDTVLIKTKHGRNVSMEFKDFTEDVDMYEGEGPNAEVLVQREHEELEERKKKRKRAAGLSSMKKIFENKEKLAEVQELEEESVRKDRLAKKAKIEDIKHEKHDLKTFSSTNFSVNHMKGKSSIAMCDGDWNEKIHPLLESWNSEYYQNTKHDENVVPKITIMPVPVQITPYHCEAEVFESKSEINKISVPLENVPCVNPLKPLKTKPSETVLAAVKEMPKDRVLETINISEILTKENKTDMLPSVAELHEVIKNIKKGKREKIAKIPGLTLDINKAKKFIPGHHVNTPQGPVFVPGQSVQTPAGPLFVPGLSVNTPGGPALIPGHIVNNENTNEPFFLAGQVLETTNGEEFVCGQVHQNKDDTYRFTEGQTVISEEGLKFIPGKVINQGSDEVFVPGQTLMTPDGIQFIPGQTISENDGIIFTPGQNTKINNEYQFVPGQTVTQNNELHFVPGCTLATPNGLKFVPGQTVVADGEICFVPGMSKVNSKNSLEFVPGATVETDDGPRFIEGQIVHTDTGEKFLPGKTVKQMNGHIEFQVAKSAKDITLTETTPSGLPIDIKTCSVSEESLYVFGHMIQTANGIEFYPGSRVPSIEGKIVPGRLVKSEINKSRFVPGMMIEGIFVPGQVVFTENGEQFVPGQVVDTADGPKFVPGQVVNTKTGPKFVPGQTIHTMEGPRFVPGQIIETKAGPTFIPGQVISTDEGSRFVPGQVVDTEEGPRFVPGRVLETDDNGVTFVPGQIVQTPQGLKFIAPDLTEGEEGLEFSVQSFIVTPEELKLLKVNTNPNDTTSTRGELSIDTNMLRQLSEAGMTVGRQVPADLPAVDVVLNETKNAESLKALVSEFGLKDDVANQLMSVISSIIEMSTHLRAERNTHKSDNAISDDIKKPRSGRKKPESVEEHISTVSDEHTAHHENIKNSIAAAVLAALVTAEQFQDVNNNNSKEKYQLILKSINTILGKAIDEEFVSEMYKILQSQDEKEDLCEDILENTSDSKVELIKIAVTSSLKKHSVTDEDIIEKFSVFLSSENEILGPAFKNITKNNPKLLNHVLSHISESISFIKTDHDAVETLQKAIVTAVQDSSTKSFESAIENKNKDDLDELLVQSVCLAKILGMSDVASSLMAATYSEDKMSQVASDPQCLNIIKRMTVMKKLAENSPELSSALEKLKLGPVTARSDPNLRELVRESAVLLIIPEDQPLVSSEDVPLSLLQPENSIAMEEFLFQRKRYSPTGALLIIKKGLQAVFPREASRGVLTGKIAYTVLDENGIRRFEPMHVFSALNLAEPARFTMFNCPVVEDDDEDLRTFTGYCNISNLQRITRFGGWRSRLYDRSQMSSLDSLPSYKGYSSRSMSRSRSSCSRSPPKVEDVVVATTDYTATSDDEVSLKAGDIVEVLDTKSSLGSKKPRLDPDLNIEGTALLDSSAARHKLACRPKKNHPKGRVIEAGRRNGERCQRWLVRVLEDMEGGDVRTRQGWVPAWVVQDKEQTCEKDQTAMAARRQAVVRELIETEEEFGRDMQQVVNQYMKPMDKATTPKVVFDNRELLFSNFKQIAEFHNTVLLEGIKYYAGEPRMLGRALLRMEREFDKHVGYCRDEPCAQQLLATDPVVKTYFQDLADDLGDDKGITEHLKLPIQRINDYQLLLKELVKYSKRLGEDCADLQKALELFLGVPNRHTDNKFIASIEGYRGNIYKLGRLLTHDWFTVTDQEHEGKPKDRYLFLFKARILVCKVKRVAEDRSIFVLKDIIKLPEVEVRDCPEDKLKFDLLDVKSGRKITLGAHKEELKTAWLTEIKQQTSNVVALAEHAADDLQVLVDAQSPPLKSPEPSEDKRKKRERDLEPAESEESKRSRVEDLQVTEVLTREESLQQLKSKRKASLEKAEVAKKISKTEVSESISEVKESSEVISGSVKSSVVTESSVEQTKAISESVSKSQATSVQSSSSVKVEESLVQQSSIRKSSIVESSVSSKTASESVTSVETSQRTEVSSAAQKSATNAQTTEATVTSSETVAQATAVTQQSAKEATLAQSATLLKETAAGQEAEGDIGQTGDEDMSSRYGRSSRLSEEYSSSRKHSSSSSRYESSNIGTGLTSSYSRRESGSRLESGGKIETGGALENSSTNRYEASSKYESSAKIDGAGSKIDSSSSYSSSKAIANGSIATGEYESMTSIKKSESHDGKPVFSKNLEGQNIEPGENATFECNLRESTESVKVTWLKDNRPLTDKLMDRVNVTSNEDGSHKLELMHCREDDSGLYTARAENTKGNSHCTAQLVVYELTPEQRRERNALNAPYFLVALKDTEIMENTYLRFMVKVKGDPNPDVTFFRNDKEIRSDCQRIMIVRTFADRGCYELVIPDVTPADKGKYTCKAINIYGDVTSDAYVTVVDDKNIFGELAPGGEGLLAKGEKATFSWKKDGEAFNPEERFKVLLGDDEDSLALVFQHVKPEDAGLYTCVAKTSTGNISCSAELTVQGAVNQLYREPEKPKLVVEHREAIVSAGGSAMLELVCKGYPKPELVFKKEGKTIEADARHKFLYEDDETMSLVIKNVTSEDAGTYQVTASNDLGADSTEMKLVVKAPPKFKSKIEDQTCMMSASLTITIEVEGTPTPEVSFYKDGVLIKSTERIQIVKETEEIYKIVIKDAQLNDSGSYSVVAKNELNQSSDFWSMQVVSPPKITKKLGAEILCEEKESVKLEIKTVAEPAPTVKWFKNKTELVESSSIKISSSNESHSVTISSSERADAGEYSCEVRNIHGTATDSTQVRVRGGPTFTRKLKDTTAKEGDVNVEFTVSVEAYPEPAVQWYHGDVEITEKKSMFTRVDEGSVHKLILKEVTAEMGGQYCCRVKNELGQDSCQATFTVNKKPRITKSLVDMTVDAGQTLKLEVEVEGCPEPKLKWLKDGKELNTDARIRIERDTQRLENYYLTVTLVKEEDGGEYEVIAENEMGSVSSKSTVTVHTREVHSQFRKESILENEIENGKQTKKLIVEEEVDIGPSQEVKISKITAETIEEKSFWDDHEDEIPRKSKSEPVGHTQISKSVKFTIESEITEESSGVDSGQQLRIENKDKPSSKAAKFTIESEIIEGSFDDTEGTKNLRTDGRQLVSQQVFTSMTVSESVEEQSFWGDDEPNNEKKLKMEDHLSSKSSRKSFSQTEDAEEKSISGDKAKIADYSDDQPNKSKKSFSEPDDTQENSIWNENNNKNNQGKVDDVDSVLKKATKLLSELEENEEKSFWDDHTSSKETKSDKFANSLKKSFAQTDEAAENSTWHDKAEITHYSASKPKQSNKSFSEPDDAEENNSFWDDNNNKNRQQIDDFDTIEKKDSKFLAEPEETEGKSFWDEHENSEQKKPNDFPKQPKKSYPEPEQNSFWDDSDSGKPKKLDNTDTLTQQTNKSFSEPDVAEEKSFCDDNNKSKYKIVADTDEIPEKSPKSFSEPEVASKKSLLNDEKLNQIIDDDSSNIKPKQSTRSVSQPEKAEEKSVLDDDYTKPIKPEFGDRKLSQSENSVAGYENSDKKSFWDENNDDTKYEVTDVDDKPRSFRRSMTEPKIIEESSVWGDEPDDGKTRKPLIEEIDDVPKKPKKYYTEPEEIEEKSLWDENHNQKSRRISVEHEFNDNKKSGQKGFTEPETADEIPVEVSFSAPKRKSVIKDNFTEEPLSAESEGRVFETVTTFKSGGDGSIIVSKVSSARSHGAIITGPAETHTIHRVTSTSVHYEDDDDCGFKKIIKPNAPHKTSLEVEEIASHSYFMSGLGHYTMPDYLRRGTYGVIEEPATDSEAESSRCGRSRSANRTISIVSMSEDETSWHNEPLSRDISIEDLSKSIFDLDDHKKVFSKDSYVRQASFKEDYFTDGGEKESVILKEKSQKIFENDVTEKLINIKREFDETDLKDLRTKVDDVKNRIFDELVLGDLNKVDSNITKNIRESTVERKKGIHTIVEEDEEDAIEALLKRSQKQRSILEDILTHEEEQAPPTVKDSNMKDSHIYESLPLVYTVEAAGAPAPTVRWLHNGEEVKPSRRIYITDKGNLHKLEIDSVEMDDAGKWQCELVNDVGKKMLKAELSIDSVNEFRKPIFTKPLEAQHVMQKEPVILKAVCTADPLPKVAWLLNGVEIAPSGAMKMEEESREIEHGLKECTYTLHLPSGRHTDTGVYTIVAKNQYGVGESSARLDILLRPEIEGLKDINAAPYEETSFIANIHANPIAEVQWSKDGFVIQPSPRHEIVEDRSSETFQLIFKKVGMEDGGVYTLTAKNELGETAQQARLNVHTGEPIFTKPLQKQTVKDYDDCSLKVRCDGVPKPNVIWYRNGEEIRNDERHAVTTEVGGQVDSELNIKHFCADDVGKYKVRATSCAGEAMCEADIVMAQTSPTFAHRLERQKDVDEGEPLELKAKLDGSPIPKATWYKDGEPIPADHPTIKQIALPDGTVKLCIDSATPADCGAYKLVISNPNGENAALCAVAVNPTPRKPSFSQELEDVKTSVGQPLKLEVKVMAFPAPEVKWFKDGLPIRPSQAVNFINQPGGVIGLSIDSARPEDAGVYSVAVSNKLGDVCSKVSGVVGLAIDSAMPYDSGHYTVLLTNSLGDISCKAKVEVTQREKKPGFVSDLQPTKVIEGFPAKLEVKIVGHPPPTVKWTLNGKEIVPDGVHIKVTSNPDGTHSLTIDKARPEDAGEYAVVASNEHGESKSTAPLTVASRQDDSQPQERPRLIHNLRDVTAEEGQPLSISAPFVGNPIPEVTWTKDGQPLLPSDKVKLTCDGKRVGLEINEMEMPDAGVYGVKLVNPLGEDGSDANISVRKVYHPPTFTQTFSDLQQLPTFDAKFPARVNGVPTPEISWYKDGVLLSEGPKFHIKRDGDACCLYVRGVEVGDAGSYKCVARNREGEASCEARLEVADTITRKVKAEPPSFLKKIGDIEVFRGLSAKFTACATGSPDPDVEWFHNGQKVYPSDRIRMDKETTGLLRLTISGVDPSDVGTYCCRIFNPHGEEMCAAELTYDTLEPRANKRPISDQYSDFDKMKKTGIPMPLADKPIISRMADRHLTLSWKPSIPHAARFPVTYQVEMCEVPDGDWFTARTGLRSCVCDIRNLEPFRDYKFRIRVENKYGVSDPSPYAITQRSKLEPDPPKFVPYLEPGIDFRPDTSPYFPKDFDIERPPHDNYAQAPRFLRQEHDCQYGVKGHNVNLFWFVYGYPKPKMQYFFNDEPIEIGGRYDWSYTRNGQATLFINKMLERDAGWFEAVATNEHGQARQRVRLELAEYPTFIKRPEESVVMLRKTAKIEARVTGVPYPEIKWYKDWQPLAASARIKIHFHEPDTVTLIINDAIMKDGGLYSVSARNVAGAASASAMLHVEEDEHQYQDKIREHPPRVKASTKPFGDHYDLGDELGRGVQGVVYHAAERLSGRNYAAKVMHGHSELKPFMKNELDIMNQLNDRHLIRLHDAYEHDHTVALVTELASGGELVKDKMLRSSTCTEREVAGYIRQLLRGLKHMHDNNIAHLGLTIGELLVSHAGSDELKLCDFGVSRRVQFGKHATLDYGMPEFVAPEVANGEGVSYPADMWSTGVITYILLGGHSPFRGANDRDTLTNVRDGKWGFHDEEWWSRFSRESRDFISKLLTYKWTERMDVDQALAHPWLNLADKIYHDEYNFNMDRLRNYYNLYRDWTSNASCRNWFRRRPLSGAFEHPSKMVYPPGHTYTPEGSPMPERDPHDRKGSPFDLQFKQWEHPDWEVSAKSESHYQNGPDTYLLQLRDTGFPVRLREYMKVACSRSPTYTLGLHDNYDPRTPIIRERRRFTDIMDEEIDDERRDRINNYGSESYTIRRLRHELGTRLDSYAEADALMQAKKDGQLPFFREKPQLLPIKEGEPGRLSCLAVGDPKPSVQWFKNDMVIAEGQRIKIVEDEAGRSTLTFNPCMNHDVGFYKVVARNKVGQTLARTRLVEAMTPDAPDSPSDHEVSDTEVLLRWKQPKHDGNSPILCYNLEYKEGDSVEWKNVADNIDHEFFVVRNLVPNTSYQFRLASRNRIGWSDKGIPTKLVKTKEAGAPKIEVTKAMKHLQQMTEAGQEIVLDEEKPKLDYSTENNPVEWDASDKFTEKYSFISEVWRGKFSIVVKGVDRSNDSVVIAKILENRPETEVPIQREFECLRRLKHERICNLLAAYQAPGSSVSALIMEKLQGADVLTYLSSRHDYSEQIVATIVTQVLDGLQYLHWRGYCHLDLQPDNVVMASVRSIQVKLVDMGSAHKVTKLGTSVPQVGDLEFKAPEIIADEPAYPQTDIWSVGVLTYILLSGVSPFRGETDGETKQNIAFVRYRFEHLYKEITQEATRFLMFLFKKVPLKRPTAEECYEHRWLTQSDFMNKKRERAVFLGNRLKEFSEEYHEKKAQAASQADTISTAFGQISPRLLTRSNSIQEELFTNFASH